MQGRILLSCLLIVIVLFSIPHAIQSYTPNDTATATTSISQLTSPQYVLIGQVATVTFTLSYSMGPNPHILAYIWSRNASFPATGSASSSPDRCPNIPPSDKYAGTASCPYNMPQYSSGTESLTFNLKFQSPGRYDLIASAIIVDSSANIISGSRSAQEFWITTSQTMSSSRTTRSEVTSIVSSPVLEMPQLSESSTISIIAATGAVIATVALAAIIIHNRQGKRPKRTKAEAKKLTSSKSFCIDCGSELPLKSKFCNNCGTKQP